VKRGNDIWDVAIRTPNRSGPARRRARSCLLKVASPYSTRSAASAVPPRVRWRPARAFSKRWDAMEKGDREAPLHVILRRPTSRVRRVPRWLIEDGRDARAHSALDDDTSAYRMHVQREFPISSAASDLCACWAGRPHAVASTAIEIVSHGAACRQQRSRHEIIEDCRPGH
jgi:hypothetical protein